MLYIITNPRTAPEVCSSSKGPGMRKKGGMSSIIFNYSNHVILLTAFQYSTPLYSMELALISSTPRPVSQIYNLFKPFSASLLSLIHI